MGNACLASAVCAHSLRRASAHAQHRQRDDRCASAADSCTHIAAAHPYTRAADAIFANPICCYAGGTIASIIASLLANTQL